MLECVINVSEGQRDDTVAEIATAAGDALLDLHSDPSHNRAVLTLAGPAVEAAARAVAAAAVGAIDIRRHSGAHPRLGAVDVVPFVPLRGSTLADAVAARDRFAAWAAESLALPCFLYGVERTLPEIRRLAFAAMAPQLGPPTPHPSAGAVCVGARPLLVAYNLWLAPPAGLSVARAVAAALRGPAVRALGLDLRGMAQVSLNLVDPPVFGPADAYDAVAERAPIRRAELVGLVPKAVLDAVDASRWEQLDLDPSRTIEDRLRGA